MIRAVLVGWSDGDWRLYRQPQWMAEVRRAPEAARLPRRHFDVDEAAFVALVGAWDAERAGAGEAEAVGALTRGGGVEIVRG